jgi:hypothetical protein
MSVKVQILGDSGVWWSRQRHVLLVLVLVAVVVLVTVVGVVTVLVCVTVVVSVVVVLGCLTVTFADCDVVVGLAVWVSVDVTVLAPTPDTAAITKATAKPAMKATIAAAQVHDRRG